MKPDFDKELEHDYERQLAQVETLALWGVSAIIGVALVSVILTAWGCLK